LSAVRMSATRGTGALNQILAGNVDEREFVTNEHRYLAIVRQSDPAG
jgi:hypothetical protein